MKLISSVDEINRTDWSRLVNESDTASFFQTPECFEFFQSLSFLEPFIVGYEIGNSLKAVVSGYVIAEDSLLKRRVSKRAIIHGGPVLGKDITLEELNLLLIELRKYLDQQDIIYAEIRNYNDFSKYKMTFEDAGFKYFQHYNFHVKLIDKNTNLQMLSKTKRRQLNLAGSNDVSWELSNEKDDLIQFYSILSKLYKHQLSLPLYPFEFFEKILTHAWCLLFVIKKDGKLIGGNLCVKLNDQILYEWFVCGQDRATENTFPSLMATWAVIEYGTTNSFKMFDMMGAGSPKSNSGVRNFKSKFGGELVEYGRFRYTRYPLVFAIAKTLLKSYQYFRKRS